MQEISLTSDSTDISLFVKTSDDELASWDKSKIIDALVSETECPRAAAENIATDVENLIVSSGLKQTSTILIRELVNSRLSELGMGQYALSHTRYGLPPADIEKILYHKTNENANTIPSPESAHKYFGDAISKQYALEYLFPVKYRKAYLSEAHLRGDIHIHDLDYFITRPYCAGHDLRFVAKYGLFMDGSGKKTAVAKPAKYADVLLLHAAKWLGVNQAYFSGAQAFSMFNVVAAPYLRGMDDERILQMAQMFIFEMAQMSVARGAQVVFSDINIDFGVPKILRDAPAIGPKGQVVGVYGDFQEEAKRFASALLKVYGQGDARGVPFLFPKPLLKIRKENIGEEGFDEYMTLAHQVSATMGNPYYINQVTYEDENISMCCRLRYKLRPEDMDDMLEGKARSSAIQNVTINLPRLAYLAKGDDARLFELLRERMEWMKEVHMIKKEVIAKLLNSGMAPLLTMEKDGEPYLRLEKCRYLLGVLGLNELVQAHTGQELHESAEAFKFGFRVIHEMGKLADEFSEQTGHIFSIEQTPAESTAYRFAKLDLKHFNGQAAAVVKGDKDKLAVYYTNSTQFNPAAQMPLPDKIRDEGIFHPLIEAGAISHVWLGESSPDPEAMSKFTLKMLGNTMNQQIAYTRELTYCASCGRLVGGLPEKCPACGSVALQSWSRITGYLQSLDGWNVGKLAELRDRYRYGKYFPTRAITG